MKVKQPDGREDVSATGKRHEDDGAAPACKGIRTRSNSGRDDSGGTNAVMNVRLCYAEVVASRERPLTRAWASA